MARSQSEPKVLITFIQLPIALGMVLPNVLDWVIINYLNRPHDPRESHLDIVLSIGISKINKAQHNCSQFCYLREGKEAKEVDHDNGNVVVVSMWDLATDFDEVLNDTKRVILLILFESYPLLAW